MLAIPTESKAQRRINDLEVHVVHNYIPFVIPPAGIAAFPPVAAEDRLIYGIVANLRLAVDNHAFLALIFYRVACSAGIGAENDWPVFETFVFSRLLLVGDHYPPSAALLRIKSHPLIVGRKCCECDLIVRRRFFAIYNQMRAPVINSHVQKPTAIRTKTNWTYG